MSTALKHVIRIKKTRFVLINRKPYFVKKRTKSPRRLYMLQLRAKTPPTNRSLRIVYSYFLTMSRKNGKNYFLMEELIQYFGASPSKKMRASFIIMAGLSL